ncbi:MAG: hypothetical protein SGPRY_013681, partial [Prymnesium sp.]
AFGRDDHARGHTSPASTAPSDLDHDDPEDDPAPTAYDDSARPGVPAVRPQDTCRTPGCWQRIFHQGLYGPAPFIISSSGGKLAVFNLRAHAAFGTSGGVGVSISP